MLYLIYMFTDTFTFIQRTEQVLVKLGISTPADDAIIIIIKINLSFI